MIATHEHTQQDLWQCNKCKVYYIWHYGIYLGYECKVPNIGGWISEREEEERKIRKMKIKIAKPWNDELDEYKEILDKYNAQYKGEDHSFNIHAEIEIKDLDELFTLAKELGSDIIISHMNEKRLTIYDDYIE